MPSGPKKRRARRRKDQKELEEKSQDMISSIVAQDEEDGLSSGNVAISVGSKQEDETEKKASCVVDDEKIQDFNSEETKDNEKETETEPSKKAIEFSSMSLAREKRTEIQDSMAKTEVESAKDSVKLTKENVVESLKESEISADLPLDDNNLKINIDTQYIVAFDPICKEDVVILENYPAAAIDYSFAAEIPLDVNGTGFQTSEEEVESPQIENEGGTLISGVAAEINSQESSTAISLKLQLQNKGPLNSGGSVKADDQNEALQATESYISNDGMNQKTSPIELFATGLRIKEMVKQQLLAADMLTAELKKLQAEVESFQNTTSGF